MPRGEGALSVLLRRGVKRIRGKYREEERKGGEGREGRADERSGGPRGN
jgi:hypothetical protein